MPLKPSKPDQVNVSFTKEIIHGNIPWSNAYVDEDVTIDPIVNAMMLAKVVFHIFQQGPRNLPQILKHLIKQSRTFQRI
jgi:hypothetical protein